MRTIRRLLPGGSDGNEHLTAAVAVVLLVLLVVEGATLLSIRPLLTVHAFVGILLIPVVALKLGSTGWRMLRYYLGGEDYVRRGPPHALLRMVVAPLVVASTILLFATGVGLLALDQTTGTLVALHKATFIVWLGATSVHVLAHVTRLPRFLRRTVSGAPLRLAALTTAVACGVFLAVATLPAADRLQDDVSAHVGMDVE